MPYPMVPGSIDKRWENVEESIIGLPIDLIRELDSTHYSFYLQNRENIKVEEYNKRILFTILDDNLGREIYKKIYGFEPVGSDTGHFFFGEKDLEIYLNIINFDTKNDSEFRIDGIPESRFITSKQINKKMDELFGD